MESRRMSMTQPALNELSQNEKIVWSCWESKTLREVVREAAAKGTHVSLALRFLCTKQKWDEDTAREWFNAEVLAWVLQLLSRKQFFKASHVLNKMQIPPHKHMMSIALESLDTSLRDYIIEQLTKSAVELQKESPEEWKMLIDHWNLLKSLECSFHVDGTIKQNRAFGIGKDLIIVRCSEVQSYTIEKIQQMENQWKTHVATYIFIEKLDFNLSSFIDPSFLWKILILQNKAIFLKRWISVSYLKERSTSDEALLSAFQMLSIDIKAIKADDIKKLDDLLSGWQINDEMIELLDTSTCFNFTKIIAFDALSINGYFGSEEKGNLKSVLQRLSRTQSLGCTNKVFSKSSSTITKTDFNNMVAKYCIENNEYHCMTTCVDPTLLENKFNIDTFKGAENCLDLWLLFKETAESKGNKQFILSMYEACKFISDCNVDQYLSENPILLLAMIIFDGKMSLFEIFNETNNITLHNVNINLQKKLCDTLPHMYSVYQRHKHDKLIIKNDVNVYQLLSGYKGLDISKLFEFQLLGQNSKKIHSFDKCDIGKLTLENCNVSIEEMPHFLNKKLVCKYGYQNKLNYVYYLKQNRPCMAAQALLVQQYQQFGRLSSKMIHEACGYAHTLALQNWDDVSVTSSCISFIEMVGGDSIKCRNHITCAVMVASYIQTNRNMSKDDAKKYVSGLMEKLMTNDTDTHVELLTLFEKATEYKLNENKCESLSVLFYEWQSVVRFSYFHNLPKPETQLKKFVKENEWLKFLIFGDIFKYDKHTMLLLSKEFTDKSLVEHIKQATLSQINDDSTSSEMSKSKEENRKISKESIGSNKSTNVIDFNLMNDVWEVMTSCHGPEDPPGALIKASSTLNCPILALIATCYEPDAAEICWAQWLLSNLRIGDGKGPEKLLDWELSSDIELTDNQMITLMEVCLEVDYLKTLYESLLVFHKDSSLCALMKFIIQTVVYFDFGAESLELLKYFNDKIVHQVSVMGQADGYGMPRLQKPKFVQTASISLIVLALSKSLTSPVLQKKFLNCLCDVGFSKDFIVPHPDFTKISALLDISIECDIKLNLFNMCQENTVPYQKEYIELLKASKMYESAIQFAKIVGLPTDHILITKWTEYFHNTFNSTDNQSQSSSTSNNPTLLQFWTKCSLAFKDCNSNPIVTIEFLKKHCDDVEDKSQKFYFLCLISNWFCKLTEESLLEVSELKDQIEFEMWMTYISCDSNTKLHLLSENDLYEYILNDNNYQLEDANKKTHIFFSKTINQIEQESNIANMSITNHKLSVEDADKCNRAIVQLLENGLLNEAWRLSKMFSAPPGYGPRPLQSLEVVDLSLRLAEGFMNPCDLPAVYRNIISLAQGRRTLTESECSDNSFEELVLIPERQDDSLNVDVQIAGRDEVNCLCILEALASKSGFKVVKQVANIFRISLQIGWSYEKVLKYDEDPLELINSLSGRSRMPLAKIILKTYDIPSEKFVEYLCSEIICSVVSPHLTKTSGFNQKEHFRYTLWGYPIDSDFEMFLNLHPDNNSALGRMIIDHLGAFRNYYKSDESSLRQQSKDLNEVDVDVIINEEYQNIDEEEVESVVSQQSASTLEEMPSAFDSSKKKFDTQSIVSASTLYTRKTYARDKRPQPDVISYTNMKVKSSIKLNIKSLLNGAKISSKQVNVITIELLILAHECFSSVCDTEGIATVLRSAQTLSSLLLAARSWRLMVRLITGLARYTEMAYIFQMLKDHDQFEFLLGQFDYMLGNQQDKITNFKQGILDFLKTHCPNNTEMYCIVALHFSMYSEAAEVKKKQAKDFIVTLKEIALDSMKISKKKNQAPEWIILANNESSRLLLDTAIHHCTDSAELYSKAGCLGAAREMAGMAQILALQSSLLNKQPTKCILNLDPEKMVVVIDTYLNFMEGLVYALASDGGGGGWMKKWRELVYQRVLRNGESQFVKDIAANRPDIAYYVIERYECETKTTVDSETNISLLKSFFK